MSSSRTPGCLVKGSLRPALKVDIDEVFHLPHIVRPGETISSTGLSKKAGGKGANQAAAVARAGGSVDLDARIGDDGVWVKDLLRGYGVGVDRVEIVDQEVTGRAIIQSDQSGENSIVLHKGANFHVSSSDASPSLSSYTHLLLQNEIPLATTTAFLQHAAAAGVTSIFNPSPMLTASELRDFPWKDLSWLIVNAGELVDLLQALQLPSVGGEENRKDAPKDVVTLATSEHFQRKVGIICTLGSHGILWCEPGGKVRDLPAGKANKVVDTTGAGDCFAGSFAAGLMRGESVEEALKYCLTACAMCVEKAGASESYPPRDEVLARLARQ